MKYSFTLIAALYALPAFGQDTMRMSLAAAFSYAEKNNPAFQNTQTDVEIAKQTVNQIKANGLPQVNASANFQQYITIPGSWVPNSFSTQPGAPDYLFFRFQQKYASTASIGVNQLLWDGTFLMGLKAATEYVSLSQTLVNKSKADLYANVSKAYLLALTTAKNMALVNSNMATLEKSLKDITALNKEGFAEKLDVQRLELALSNLKVQKDKLQNAAMITQNLLKFQMGMDVNTPLLLTDDLETLDKSMGLAETEKDGFNVKNRVEHKLLQQTLSLSYLDERRYKLGYLPTLVGFLQHQESTNRPEFNFFKSNLTPNNNWVPASLWGLSLQVPVFDGLRKQAQIRDVRLRRMKTQNDLKNFENAANLEYTNARLSYDNNLKQVAVQKQNLELARDIYEKANVKFKEGVGSTLEILQAENELKTSQTNYLNALYDLVVSKIDLQKATGTVITE
ncbi:MAG: TolC family protein [Bacteroidetes bacterium]|nr:TolC family protein [Bacteroidota bacterium]